MTDQPASNNGSLVMGIIAGLIAAAVGSAVWFFFFKALGNVWIPPLLIGLMVGFAMRLLGKTRETSIAIAAVILTALGCIAGFIWADSIVWTPFMFDQTLKRLVNDLPVVLLIAIGCYIAFALARRPLGK